MLPSAESLEGKPVPSVVFKTRPHDAWQDLTSDELFKGKTVVVFALPGAYTPTCSSTHLPRLSCARMASTTSSASRSTMPSS